MSNLILDFESKIIDKNYSISDLLRHCLVIATKLKQTEFVKWINLELSGYDNLDEIPKYRKVPVFVKFFNPVYGWCPYIIADESINRILNNMSISNKISEIEALSKSDNDIIRMSIPIKIKKVLMEPMEFETDICYESSKLYMTGILDSVKNEMLNWILKLEEVGIVDNEYEFSEKQIEQATKITNQIINNFYGDKNKIDLKQEIGDA